MLTSPKTVEQAIAPFKKITANLKTVLTAQKKAKSTAQNRIVAARLSLHKTETAEEAKIKTATEEELRAVTLIDNLEKLFSGDVTVKLDTLTPAEKVNAGRKLES